MADPLNWNPWFGAKQMQNKGIYEDMFYTDLNTGKVTPWLAESYTYSPDGTEITVKLRDKVTWCDGVQFTADDWKFTIDLAIANVATDPELGGAALKAAIKTTEVIDPLTFKITLNSPDLRWFRDNYMTSQTQMPIVPKHLFDGQDPKTFTFFDLAKGWPCGTGPYKVVESNSQQYILDRRATWWGSDTGFSPMPAPQRLIVVPMASRDAAAQALISNDVDTTLGLLPGAYEPVVAANPKIEAWAPTGPVWGAQDGYLYDFVLNTQSGPTADVNVRLAINYALDRQKGIVDTAYEGSNRAIVLPFSSWWSGNWTNVFQPIIDKYDRGTPSQAKVDMYMTQAGYAKNAAGKWAKNGKTVDVPALGPTFIQPLAPVIAQMLNDAGFVSEVNLDPNWTKDFLSGKFTSAFFIAGFSGYEPYDTLKEFASGNVMAPGTDTADIMDAARWSNPQFDQDVATMKVNPPDPTPGSAYATAAAQAADIFLQNMPVIPLAEELWILPYNNTYWTGWPDSADPYTMPYIGWDCTYMMWFHIKPTGAS